MAIEQGARPVDGPEPIEPVVRVTGLTKRYGAFAAVDDVTFSLGAGTITGFVGPNGSGKSTTLRLLLGLARASAGEARVFGRAYRDLEQPARYVGALLESDDLDPGRSGRDHLRVLAIAGGLPDTRVDAVLELVGLARASDQRVRTYSLGMRQRLGLAAALLGEPRLLLLDEPANGLDRAGVHWLRTFLRRFSEGGGTILLTSHLLTEVAQTADRVLIIDDGRLVSSVEVHELAASGETLEARYLAVIGGQD